MAGIELVGKDKDKDKGVGEPERIMEGETGGWERKC